MKPELMRKRADMLQRDIDQKLRPLPEKGITRKRLEEFRVRLTDGRLLQAWQGALRVMADAMDSGTLPGDLALLSNFNEVKATLTNETDAAHHSLMRIMPEGVTGKLTHDDDILLASLEITLNGPAGFFPTPDDVTELLLGWAHIRPGDLFLEPSAGSGSMAEFVLKRHPDTTIEVAEIHPGLQDLLRLKGFTVIHHDCFAITETKYDVIMANPPFENLSDIAHAYHYFSLLKPGGRLVCIMSNSPFFKKAKEAKDFRAWLEQHEASTFDLPEGAFKKAVRSTGVNMKVIVVDKPGATPRPKPKEVINIRELSRRQTYELHGFHDYSIGVLDDWATWNEKQPPFDGIKESWDAFRAAHPIRCGKCGTTERIMHSGQPKTMSEIRCWKCFNDEFRELTLRAREAEDSIMQMMDDLAAGRPLRLASKPEVTVSMGETTAHQDVHDLVSMLADAGRMMRADRYAIVPVSERRTLREVVWNAPNPVFRSTLASCLCGWSTNAPLGMALSAFFDHLKVCPGTQRKAFQRHEPCFRCGGVIGREVIIEYGWSICPACHHLSEAERTTARSQTCPPSVKRFFAFKKEVDGQYLAFTQIGDFYEAFSTDAVVIARELDLVLTSRRFGKDLRIPMCGVPYTQVEHYAERLREKGYTVNVIDGEYGWKPQAPQTEPDKQPEWTSPPVAAVATVQRSLF